MSKVFIALLPLPEQGVFGFTNDRLTPIRRRSQGKKIKY